MRRLIFLAQTAGSAFPSDGLLMEEFFLLHQRLSILSRNCNLLSRGPGIQKKGFSLCPLNIIFFGLSSSERNCLMARGLRCSEVYG